MSENSEASSGAITSAQAHNFGRSPAGVVFGLALVAAACALGLMWLAWSALDDATREQRIANPPDLKRVVEAIEDGGRELAGAGAAAASEGNEDQTSLRGEDPEYDRAVDDAV